ncbi:GGDEF domain-containing protein [Leptolyngbya sp. FACHB-261]|uniref:GGDEF domain-containing protein n=1 Tax=Leptolyngbya sp. FACHB-261 TaxID=2692806 RepID=UPI001686B973|nr:GGDEF domain-containing protein [Leptolyngbya sp. FACHB-261]
MESYSQQLNAASPSQSGAELSLVQALLAQLAVLQVENHHLKTTNRKLQQVAYTDALTQVGNRRAFDQAIKREWRSGCRTQSTLAVVMVDLDFFKRHNDTYGHQSGDELLACVANTLRTHLHRAGDAVFRYGGEEFAVVLPNTDLAGARVVAEGLRLAVEALGCTASFGVAAIVPNQADSFASLVGQADQALYQAKREGRNRVCCAD